MNRSVSCLLVTVILISVQAPNAQAKWFEDATSLSKISGEGPTAGASWGDFNGDGWPDVWIGNHSFDGAAPKLFVNNHDGTFSDSSGSVFVPADADLHGAAWADFDRDGDEDLFVMAGGGGGQGSSANLLLINDRGKLRDKGQIGGLADPKARGRTPLWLDANNDAQLDLLLPNMYRSDGAGRTRMMLQKPAGFEEIEPQLSFAPVARSIWDQVVFYSANLFDYRGQDSFGSVQVLDQFAQLGDLDGDGRVELISYGDPTYIYALDGPEPKLIKSIMLGTERQVADVALADFNGDAKLDIYVLRLRDAAPDLVLSDSSVLRSHLQGAQDNSPHQIEFKSTAVLEMEIIDPWEIEGKLPPVYVGSNRRSPNSMRFVLDPEDPSSWGVAKHVSGHAEILVSYDGATNLWTITNWAGRLNIEVESRSGPITSAKPLTFRPHDGGIPDRLMFQSAFGFTRQDILHSGSKSLTNCSSVVAEDFDNDMDVDVYLACSEPSRNAKNILLENLGEGRLERVDGFFGGEGTMRGRSDVVTTVDYDQDGFVDLFLTNGRGARPFADDGPYQLLRNVGNTNHWLQIDLQGNASNQSGIGATIRLKAGGRWQLREQSGGMHSFAQNHARVHFGLGKNVHVDQIEVTWPSGLVQVLRDVEADQTLVISENPNP